MKKPRSDATQPRSGSCAAALDANLERERRRLRRAFAALLVALAPAAAAAACSSTGAQRATGTTTGSGGGDAGERGTGGGGAGTDAGDGGDGMASVTDADAAPPEDAGPDVNCGMLGFLPADAGADAPPACFVTLPCGLGPDLGLIDCAVYDEAGPIDCTVVGGVQECNEGGPGPVPPGAVQLYCPGCLGCSGRRPAGLRRPRGPEPAHGAVGAYFARAAHDEAASVHAFRRLREELARHDAPAPLVRAAERAARDEGRHARAMAALARAAGAPVVAPAVRRRGPRSIEAIARENAVEGCVIETFGALTAAWQAAHAPDASLRRTFARIAADETRHAALAWAVARWAEGRLPPAGRARVAAARARAVRAIGDAAAARSCPHAAWHAAVDAAIGRPSGAQRARLLDGMARRLGLAAGRASPAA